MVDVDATTAERMAENEARFREANDRIENTAHEMGLEDLIPFVCECADAGCTEVARLLRSEYLAVRTDARHFLVVPQHSHVAGPTGDPIEQHSRYAVVRKVGVAAEVAEERERNPPA